MKHEQDKQDKTWIVVNTKRKFASSRDEQLRVRQDLFRILSILPAFLSCLQLQPLRHAQQRDISSAIATMASHLRSIRRQPARVLVPGVWYLAGAQ